MRKAILAMFLTFVVCVSFTRAQPLPRLPGSPDDAPPPPVHYVVSLTQVDPALGMNAGEIVEELAYLAAEPDSRKTADFVPVSVPGVGPGLRVRLTSDFTAVVGPAATANPGVIEVQLTSDQAGSKDAVAAAANRITDALKVDLPRMKRADRMREIDEQLANLKDKMELLHSISLNTAQLGPEILKDRIKAAELERQRLEMDLIAQQKRSGAITDQIQRIKKEAELRIDSDPVLKQLREVVPLREEEVKRIEQMVQSGQASQSDASAVRDKVLQANIRVAEREEALRQGASAGLLERLNEELATIMIDQVEKQVRLDLLRSQQPSIDVKGISEDKLDRLTQQYRALFRDPGTLPPLYFELERRAVGLRAEKLALLVSAVKVTDASKGPQTAPSGDLQKPTP